MRTLPRLLVVLVLAACDPGGPLSRAGDGCGDGSADARFTCRVAQRLAARIEPLEIEVVGPLELAAELGDENRVSVHLDNTVADCRAIPERCEDTVARLASALEDGIRSASRGPEPAAVRALLKSSDWPDERRRDAPEANDLVTRPFLGDLHIVYVEDRPDSIVMLTPSALSSLALDLPGVHALALENLSTACADFSHEGVPGTPLRRLVAGDSYEASRLLLPGSWRALAGAVEGALVVAAPARDEVLFGAEADVAALRRHAAERHATLGHPISTTVFVLRERGFEVLPE